MQHRLKDLPRYPLLLFFLVFILGLSLLDGYFNNREFSEMENRYLKQLPPFSWSDLAQNRYTKSYEEYVNDQFVFRDQWIGIKSLSEQALLKIENNGVAYGRDGYLFPRLYPAQVAETRNNGTAFGGDLVQETTLTAVNARQLEQNIQTLLRSGAQWNLPITLAIVPNNYEILGDKVPAGMENAPQAPLIQEVYGRLSGAMDPLDLVAPLTHSAAQRQTYYRTDHHWTTDGAHAAYAAFAQSRGLRYAALEELAPYRREEQNFLGTSYSKTKNLGVLPDTLVWYDLPGVDMTINGEKTVTQGQSGPVDITGLYQQEMFGRRDKYAGFLYGNHGLTVIVSDHNLNHTPGKTSRILLVKDSYGNSLAPFFTYSYDEVVVVDLRALPGQINQLLSSTEFDDILILYNFSTFHQDRDLARLNF